MAADQRPGLSAGVKNDSIKELCLQRSANPELMAKKGFIGKLCGRVPEIPNDPKKGVGVDVRPR